MSRPGEFKAPGSGHGWVYRDVVVTAESVRIEDKCRNCRRPMLMPPWVTECPKCQREGRPVRGARIVGVGR